MNFNWLRCFLVLCVGIAFSARAQLQFTNITNVGIPYNLYGIACGGIYSSSVGGSNNVFVAVGDGSNVVTLTFSNILSSLGQNAKWVPVPVPGASYLIADTFGGSRFLVSGTNNLVFSSTDAMNWSSNGMVFNNTATAEGLAFNNNTFVAAASAPEIDWSTNSAAFVWNAPATFSGLSFADSFRGVTAFDLSNSTNTFFAACGILGRLATTYDGGKDWITPYPNGMFNQPDLNGIASDGGQTLVGVGGTEGTATGSILAFTVTNNLGAAMLVTNIVTTNTLRAVSYIGTNYPGGNYDFMAVGVNGSILLGSNNGTTWINIKSNYQALASLNTNLNGVFFANSGIFNGVGVLVGDHGTIVLAGGTPPVPTNAVGATNSAFYPFMVTNSPLSVMLVPNNFFPAGTLTVDWFDSNGAAANGSIMSSPSGSPTNFMFYPPDNPTNLNIVYTNTYYAQTRDLRTGFVNTNRVAATITIYPRPTSVTGGTNEISNGGPTTLTNTLTGVGPWQVYWTNSVSSTNLVQNVPSGTPGVAVFNSLTLSSGIFGLTNSDPNNLTNIYYWVAQVVSSNGMSGFLSTNWPSELTGTNLITIVPRPTSVTGGTNYVGNGNPTTLTNTLTGLGPWLVYWTNSVSSTNLVQYVPGGAPGVAFFNSLTLSNGMFGLTNANANPNLSATIYCGVSQVVSTNVSNGFLCTNGPGEVTGIETVIIEPRPTSVTGGTNYVSNGDPTILTNTLTGVGPWLVYWTNSVSSTNLVQYVPGGAAGVAVFNSLTLSNGMFGFTNANANPNLPTTVYCGVSQVVSSNLSNGFLCTNGPGEVTGIETVIIEPRPTSVTGGTNYVRNGDPTTLTNTLTGVGPWLVYWTNSVSSTNLVQYVPGGAAGVAVFNSLTLSSGVFGLTNANPNLPATVYCGVLQVVSTNVSNGFLCTNGPGEVTGIETVIIEPRPTSVTGGTNFVGNGNPTTLTNTLTGVGPWLVYWTNSVSSTNLVQYVPSGAPGVAVFNSLTLSNGMFGLTNANANPNLPATIYCGVLQVVSTNVSNGFLCTNGPGEVTGIETVIIEPRPTSVTGGTNYVGNGHPTTLTNTLTGVGPWLVYWTNSVSSTNLVQYVPGGAAGVAVFNSLTLNSGVFGLTNANPNLPATIYCGVLQVVSTNVSNGFLCTNGPGEVTGIETVIIESRPTSATGGTNYVGNGNPTTLTNTLTGMGPWFVYWTNSVSTTNFVEYVTGGPPGAAYLNSLGLTSGMFGLTNANANQNLPAIVYYGVSQVVSSNMSNGLLSTNGPGEVTGIETVIILPRPTSVTGGTNYLCDGEGTTLTNTLTGVGPWFVYWTNGFTSFVQYVTNTAGPYVNTLSLPTNNFSLVNTFTNQSTNYDFWVSQVVSSNLVGGALCTNSAGGLTGTSVVIVDPVLTNAPASNGDVTSCYDVPVPLSVSVPPGFTADWYSGVSLVAAGTNLYVPPVPVNLGGNTSVTNTFMVVSRFIDPSRTNCYSPPADVSLISVACTNAITSITVSGNSVVLQWTGNYVLESTTNLLAPNLALSPWLVVTNPGVGANYWTNSSTSPPVNFYRLTTQTN